jgi:DNA-directed RNA polymerase specialized sigma24 family protein
VFQQVFINLFRYLESVREVERLAGWLLTTAQRETWRVGRRRRSEHALPHDVVDLGGPSEADIVRAEQQLLVRRGLSQLGGRCEKLLTALFLASGAPNYEAIAAELDMKVGSIGPTRARCFEKLERILVDLGVDAEVGAHSPVD